MIELNTLNLKNNNMKPTRKLFHKSTILKLVNKIIFNHLINLKQFTVGD